MSGTAKKSRVAKKSVARKKPVSLKKGRTVRKPGTAKNLRVATKRDSKRKSNRARSPESAKDTTRPPNASLKAARGLLDQRNAELAVINSIQHGLATRLDFQGIIDLVGDKLREVLRTENIGIRWRDPKTNLVRYLYEYEHGRRIFPEPHPPRASGPGARMEATHRPQVYNNRADMTADHLGIFAIGFVVSFVTAIVVVKTFLTYVTRHGFTFFAWWRVIIGTLGLIALALGR